MVTIQMYNSHDKNFNNYLSRSLFCKNEHTLEDHFLPSVNHFGSAACFLACTCTVSALAGLTPCEDAAAAVDDDDTAELAASAFIAGLSWSDLDVSKHKMTRYKKKAEELDIIV